MSKKRDCDRVTQSVSLGQWVKLVAVYLLVPLFLFLCGGDLGWWQAWLYSLLFLTAGVAGRMWAERRHPGLTAERQDTENLQDAKHWDKVLAPMMAVSITYPVVIVAGLDHRFGWSPEFPLGLTLIGFILISIGYAIAAWAFAENRFFLSVVRIQTDQRHVVCDTGPYRFVRHPGYAGSICSLIGFVLFLGSVWTLVPVAVAMIISVLRTALEDRTLKEELPGYQDYARRVRYRLISGIY